MTWGFLWLMLALKIPIAALIYIVWWAVKQTPEDAQPPGDDDGGTKWRNPHPREPFPRRPRRGPHGSASPPPPPRVRARAHARARTVGH